MEELIQAAADELVASGADIDAGIAVAVMRNRFTVGDLAAVTKIDQIVGSA